MFPVLLTVTLLCVPAAALSGAPVPEPEELPGSGASLSGHCAQLLREFGLRYRDYGDCLVPAARPVRVCVDCYRKYRDLLEVYNNISTEQVGAPANESCRDALLRSDRLMVVYLLYNNLKELWLQSACHQCITEDFQSLTQDTLYFLETLNQTLSCFQKYQQGNVSELCAACKRSYSDLNALYAAMERNQTTCIDVEDAMNSTRRQWSVAFGCSLPRAETVPVIAVSSFMLFLPAVFYLSSFLHSEQKKRKLIHPKRAKSYTTLMNIQDKRS